MSPIDYSIGLLKVTMSFSSIYFSILAVTVVVAVAAFIIWNIFKEG